MRGGMATYEIGLGDDRKTVRFFEYPCDEKDMTLDETEAASVIEQGYDSLAGKVGVTIDPFKAAERILAEHYGHARMVAADYEWRPRVRY